MLLPTEESSLKPVSSPEARGDIPAHIRVVPGFWQMPGKALGLKAAMRFFETAEPTLDQPGMSFLFRIMQLTRAMLEHGDFSVSGENSVLDFVPYWTPELVCCLGGVAELVPTKLETARFATQDDPVYAVTTRNLAVSVVGHVLDSCAAEYSSKRDEISRIPDSFWSMCPQPVIEVLVPKDELEEDVPWAVQLLFRPVPGMELSYPMEALQERLGHSLFPDVQAREGLEKIEILLDDVSIRVPALRRAVNMADGKASLNRAELEQLLDHLTLLENEGFLITLPGVENMARLTAKVHLTEHDKTDGSPRPWFEFKWTLAAGGVDLSDEEFQKLANSNSPLVFLEDRAVLLTPKDRKALEEFKKRANEEGEKISFFEALRLKLGGATHLHGLAMESFEASPRLEQLIKSLDGARELEDRPIPEEFIGELRPYQVRGHAWMYFLVDQGFGACLADDMGLGKTIQAITMILDWRKVRQSKHPILLVCPVSVLGNWRREVQKFAPCLRVNLHHGKLRPREKEGFEKEIAELDIVLTSYSLLQRDEELFQAFPWEGVILDEAQNIKNPTTRQSKAARALDGRFRVALTGTPLENRPLDLWSIMDFLNEGLLGTRTTFLQTLEHPIVKQRNSTKAGMLARLVRPFVLRRLKTDPDIIDDLPEKTEQVINSALSREQAALYEGVVRKGLNDVEKANEGIQRRGAILTTLLRLKQVCNHPAHYASDGSSLPNRSGKLDLLSEMLVEAIEEGDRCLVFTQFKEMGTLLKTHIEEIIGSKVLFLHGGVPQKDREDMVTTFQAREEDGPRVFVLSLKAGGTGLNLTAANRVFHFDRWWNPAVEDQATDRAFRIGQDRNVFVHKFVCTGTLEERIQEMLERKRDVAASLLGAGENWLTELSNDELRKLLILDRTEALT